mgnify:CR=1 FL=1
MFVLMKKFFRMLFGILILSLIALETNSEEKIVDNNHEFTFYTGLFDHNHAYGNSSLVGFQHQDHDLFRDSLLGKLSPVTGGLITADNALYMYTGVQAEYSLGPLNLTPSVSPGYYNSGNGRNLGSAFEVKSEIKLSLKLSENNQFGMSYNHISNADTAQMNPGIESYTFNFLRKF